MIIYLIYCLYLITCHFAAKCSNNFIYDLNYYVIYIYIYIYIVVLPHHSQHFWDKRDSLRNTPYQEISLIHFPQCFQIAWIILNIKMDMAFETDMLNNRILLHVIDKVLTITILNDQTLLCYDVAIGCPILFPFLASLSNIFYSVVLWVVFGSGGDDQQYRVSPFYTSDMYYVLLFLYVL